MAQPADALDAVVFAGRDIQIGGFSNLSGAPTVAGNDLRVGVTKSITAESVFLGGSYDATNGFESIAGDLTAVGDVVGLGFAGASIGGSVFSGGRVEAGAIEIAGDITATGDVAQTFNLSTVSGNITSGGRVTIEGTIGDPLTQTNGVVTYADSFSLGTFASVNQLVQGGAVAPPVFNAPTLPAPRVFSAGNNDISLATFQDLALDPGTYGTLTLDAGNTVTLTSGTYVFDDIVSGSALNELAFDTTNGPIEVLVEGDFRFDNLIQVINGEALFAGGNPNPDDAADIYFEVTGSFTTDEELYGTVYAPNGDIILDTFAHDVTGSLIAGRDVVFVSSTDVAYVRSSVPEPGSATLIGLCSAALLRRRRGR